MDHFSRPDAGELTGLSGWKLARELFDITKDQGAPTRRGEWPWPAKFPGAGLCRARLLGFAHGLGGTEVALSPSRPAPAFWEIPNPERLYLWPTIWSLVAMQANGT